jgi:hypothetical protein
MKNSRRQFFKKAGTGMVALGLTSTFPAGEIFGKENVSPGKNNDMFKLAVAGWTFNKFKLEPSLEMMEKVKIGRAHV